DSRANQGLPPTLQTSGAPWHRHRSTPKEGHSDRHAEEHREAVPGRAQLKEQALQYAAYISREGKHVLAEFPDCPGCQAFADSGDELASAAQEALEGWLEAHLIDGQIPPRPVERTNAPKGTKLARIGVRPGLAAAVEI